MHPPYLHMEEDAKPVRQPQRRLNPHMQEVLVGEPTQVVPKKSGITVIQNEKGEEVSTRPTSGWRVCIDYRRRMPFGLCNAPATFQRCMLSIFSDMVERIMEVFMDDITVYGSSYEECLLHLEAVLQDNGIEVDKAKVELIVKLPPPTNVKGIRQFLGHAGFYRRMPSLCGMKCQKSFEELKQFLTTAPIVRAPNWKLPFEVMCDASDLAMGAVLGQREDGKPYVIYYASKTLNEAQRNYTTTEKELLAVVFALDKFRAYLPFDHQSNPILRRVMWNLGQSLEVLCHDSGSKKSNASNGAQFGVETKKLQPLQVNHSKLKEAFCKVLRNDFAAFLYSVVDFLLKLPDICRTLEAENLKMKANFTALRD
ncbi:Retrovirus-related Pol polyprotein from transposon 17.6 [Vitis vinifera]|uniref:Retrovirus-related Pol polyprotein from transposon 17.6 n=1 Tax=Vitis vinifera TaxID=29760 RepID=A0A438GB47_VITVI|nr:Retrovirus-related Pol polyprotein from transposon 17.6 [Vitis vinifera]